MTAASQYVTKDEYKRQKTALTRAVNTGDPVKVLEVCEKVLEEWNGKAWPDDWHHWCVALTDAWFKFIRQWESAYAIEDRFRACMKEFS